MGKSSKKDKKDKSDKRKKDKSKHSKKRKYSSASDSSDSDGEARKRAKAERLAQKVASHLKRHAEPEEEDGDGLGPSTGKFVWHKKIEKQLLDGAKVQDLTVKAERQRQRERQEEIDKVQKRRLEREQEKAAIEEELAMIQRQRAQAEAMELEAKEEEFHLEQAVQRSQQRLREDRPRPIDLLVKGLYLTEEFDIDPAEPYHVFAGLLYKEVEELRRDIDEFVELDVKHVEFWKAMVVVADHELEDAAYQEAVDQARVRGLPPPPNPKSHGVGGVHQAVDRDVQVMLAGKTLRELEELEEGIHQQLQSGEAADPEYWTAVLESLTLHKAKARLREIHRSLLQQHVLQLNNAQHEHIDVAAAMGWNNEHEGRNNEHEDGGADAAAAAGGAASPNAMADEVLDQALAADNAATTTHLEAVDAPLEGMQHILQPTHSDEEEEEQEENHGQWSPEPLPLESIAGQEIITQEEDEELLELLRAQVKAQEAAVLRAAAARAARGAPAGAEDADRAYRDMVQGGGAAHPMLRNLTDAAPQRGELAMRAGRLGEVDDAATRQFRAASNHAMGDISDNGDAPFTGDVALESQVYWWHEKYKPRKPKYFNRVHTGYEWNKYNQTHYDSDNPPPKVVQGYKFNIFYPDLIDKQKAPTYHVERDPTSADGSTCLLRFRAGPPYEDIAFRVVNKEWEYSHKKGFRCTFERGILHLYFNFKRQRYRR